MTDLNVTRGTFDEVMVPLFSPANFVPDRGLGSRVWDTEGRDYVYFAGGIAVTALGHAHPELLKVLHDQGQKLWHIGNGYTNEPVLRLATRLTNLTFADRAFFANSGAEANEAALKLARRYAIDNTGPDKVEIISFTQSFHGRTLFTVSVGGQPKYAEGFGPTPQGITHLPYNDLAAARAAIGPQTCAVIVEPVQGEGGVLPADPAFLQGLREACDQHGALLIFDEVQTGVGRTGTFYAYMGYGVTPDILTTAKALGNGFPCAALMMSDQVAAAVKIDVLGTTFGAGPLACAAIEAVIEAIESENLLEQVRRVGAYVRATCIVGPVIGHQGAGHLTGLRTTRPAKDIQRELLARDILTGTSGDPHVLRLLSAFILEEQHVDLLRDALLSLPK